MWPRKLRWRKKPPKARRMVRKRRPHRSARDRLRSFGLSRFRYLWFIPALILMIWAVASVRVPRTTITWLQQAAAQSGARAETAQVRSGKYRTSIPAGYRLAVDIAWRDASQPEELLVELILRDGIGSSVARQTTVVGADQLALASPVTRAELDVPYDLNGVYQLSVQVTDDEGGTVDEEQVLGPLTVY
jgi:hypothetical protein